MGVKLSKDLKPTEFYLEGEEFRIMDKESVLEIYKIDPSESILWGDAYDADFLLRKASSDPKEVSSWFGLDTFLKESIVTSMWSLDATKIFLGSFIFQVESGRFQFTDEGGYAWNGPEEGSDPAFSFGKCRPYYD